MTNGLELKLIEESQLKEVSGGYIYGGGVLKGKNWEVIDDAKGEVLGRYATKEDAIKMAVVKNQITTELSWKELCEMRKVNKPRCSFCLPAWHHIFQLRGN